MTLQVRFTKGHGTENDFVLVPDPDGQLALTDAQVRFLADRRGGIGGDGVIRVVRTAAANEPEVRDLAHRAEWFMDYRNADGSRAEMCGNGTRVFLAYLLRERWTSETETAIATRDGIKHMRSEGDAFSVNLGPWRVVDARQANDQGYDTLVALPGLDPLPALSLDLGNPHTVVVLPEGADLNGLDLTRPPVLNPPPENGSNVEIVQPLGPGHLQMRVYERGVGETRSCGTGAAAAALALMTWSGQGRQADTWRVDVPGGTLRVAALDGQEVALSGPAALVADGVAFVPAG